MVLYSFFRILTAPGRNCLIQKEREKTKYAQTEPWHCSHAKHVSTAPCPMHVQSSILRLYMYCIAYPRLQLSLFAKHIIFKSSTCTTKFENSDSYNSYSRKAYMYCTYIS